MGHFAKVSNGIVTKVIVAEADFFNNFVDDSPGQWIKTSYNTRGGVHYKPNTNEPSEDQSKALRKNYAGIGYTYDAAKDAFIPPQPFNSWILNEDTCLWDAPVPYPSDGQSAENENGFSYKWNEDLVNWEKVIIEE